MTERDCIMENRDGMKLKKEPITLSLPIISKKDLELLAVKYGMTKSGLVHFLIQKLKEQDDLYK